MKKTIYLSIACSLSISAVELEPIFVTTPIGSEVVKDVRGEDIKSADLGEALVKHSPSVSLNRRSGIANDITIRGARKDNLNITIDGTKVHGACPNRMDPPISHILTNSVDFIEINEGPFSVDEFGLLSADVKIHTLKPKEGFGGEFDIGMGSFGYKKGAFSLTGGSETIKFLLSGSLETSEQYRDGNGDDFAGQIANNLMPTYTLPMKSPQYQTKYLGMDAYAKKTLTAKMFWNITDNQELRLSYTANRSDNILYPSSGMDALYDNSNIYNIEYIAKDLTNYSKKLYIQLYQSDVEHPMSTIYRLSGLPMVMKHSLTTKVQGAKVKNIFDLDNHTITTGVDYSLRNWDGLYYKNDILLPAPHSIWNVDTKNVGFFLDDSIKMGAFVVDLGIRYDSTEITTDDTTQKSNSYDGVNGYILAKYLPNDSTKYFVGIGESSRVPDGKELYFVSSKGSVVGNPNLNKVVNYEADIGAEKKYDNATIKAKLFYSKLQDYIAYNANLNSYENVDATLWGFELSGSYVATDSLYFDFGLSMQKGEKDTPLTGQSGVNLPDISPLKLNLGMSYEVDESMVISANAIVADEWRDFDSENGEQKIDAYGVLNLKATKSFAKGFELTLGVDNVLDSAYVVSNTYRDLTLLSNPTDVMLLNEAGRYYYANLKYKF